MGSYRLSTLSIIWWLLSQNDIMTRHFIFKRSKMSVICLFCGNCLLTIELNGHEQTAMTDRRRSRDCFFNLLAWYLIILSFSNGNVIRTLHTWYAALTPFCLRIYILTTTNWFVDLALFKMQFAYYNDNLQRPSKI